MKRLALIFLCCSISLSAQEKKLTIEQKKAFASFYRSRVDLLKIYPERPEVNVIFVDLDGDGLEEAFATSYEAFYETGWMWAAFKRNGDQWSPIKGYDSGKKAIQNGSSVYARPGEIFRVTKHDGTFEFLILGENYDKLAPEGMGALNKTKFQIDKEGVLQQQPIKDLERYLAYRVTGHTWPKGTLVKRLEALEVESFKD
jgi:hypothetical protein